MMKRVNYPVVKIMVVCALFLAGCNDQPEKPLPESAYKSWDLPVTLANVEKVPINYSTTGSVVSDQRIDVASRVAGYIKQILVLEGEKVVEGQPLIKLDQSDVEGAIRQAKAAMSKAISSLKDAETDLERYQNLYKRGSVSENSLRKMRLQRDVARDTQGEAQAALNTALSQQQYINITSPVTGVVVARVKREGDLATPGSPILIVESRQGLLFKTDVAESQIRKINLGDLVQIKIDALDKTVRGVVARIVQAGDQLTHRYQVKIALASQDSLLSGMFGRALFQVGETDLPVIPASALFERGGLRGVFVLDDHNHVHFRWLQVGKKWEKGIEVRAGLKGGERIVAVADARLHEGDLINEEGSASE